MLALIVLAPLAGAAVNGLLHATGLWRRIAGRDISPGAVAAVACASVLVSALLSTRLFLDLLARDAAGSAPATQELFAWIVSGSLGVSFGFLFDSLSAVMALVVTWVGFLIHVYSVGYMRGDRCFARYFAYLNLFVFFMLVLVLGDNFLMMFVGWEGVGLASYLLIGFWHGDSFRAHAGRKAFVVNRVGDLGFILGIFFVFATFGSLDYREVFSMLADPGFASGVPAATATAMALLLFAGAVGKSAQFPLHVWLPDAMAGPTAVSALIHAATMVTAGVYLIARTHVLFTLAPAVLTLVAVVGALTLLMAGFAALVQYDIKRVLAYSTISQIGYMFLALGVGAWSAALFHFMIHAFFKALLFLGAGAVILCLHHEQDMRRMGGLRRRMPFTFRCFLVGAGALAAIPVVTAGFYSKDLIIWNAYNSEAGSVWLWAGALAGALLTSLYTFRMVFLTFFREAAEWVRKLAPIREPGPCVRVPLGVLAFLSVVAVAFKMPHTMGKLTLFSDFLHTALPEFHGAHASYGVELLFELLAAAASLGGVYLAWALVMGPPRYRERIAALPWAPRVERLWLSGWGFDQLYDALFVRPCAYAASAPITSG